jgi:polypeptide N-acetylgalactosaminyltransferase
MVRVKYTFLVKIFAIVFFAFFILPAFLRLFIGPTKSREATSNYGLKDDYNMPKVKSGGERAEHLDDGGPPSRLGIHPENEAVFKEGITGNYEPILEPRSGPGEGGLPVVLDASDKSDGDRSVREYGFNMVASGKISMDRRIKDTRPAECKNWHYPETSKLPTASVVLVFVNEGWSTLLRTVHSVINTSPPELLAEVILVDDASTKDDLKEKLEKYILRFKGKVKIYRTKRVGLVRARVIGAEKAIGQVIVVLDAHCECVVNWLPPLLSRIAVNRKTLAIPIVDGITWDTLEHSPYNDDQHAIGIWEWGFLYKEMRISEQQFKEKKHGSDPNRSPTHAGGLLAIDKEWFFELGGYDPGIKIWGAEQYELSFKVWQCGGIVEWVPCSHVAHIYRGPRTESVHPPGGHPYQSSINHMRLAEVWMDEYKEYYYIREPQIRHLKIGDITNQIAIREKLQCKPFKWFMENVAYDLPKKFPLPPKNKVWGEAVNAKHSVCLDVRGAGFGQPIGVSYCHHGMGNQLFRLNVEGEMSSGEHCFISDKNIVKKKFCLDYQGVWNPIGEWKYDDTTSQVISNKEKTCLSTDGKDLTLETCNENDESQKWKWKEIYIEYNAPVTI